MVDLKLINNTPNSYDLELLTLDETAKILKVSKQTLYQWKYNNKIPFVKIGGKLCFEKGSILNFIQSNMVA